MEVYHPTPNQGHRYEVVTIVDLGPDPNGIPTVHTMHADVNVAYIRRDGDIANHRGYSYEYTDRDCILLKTVEGNTYLTSRAGAQQYLAFCAQETLAELDEARF